MIGKSWSLSSETISMQTSWKKYFSSSFGKSRHYCKQIVIMSGVKLMVVNSILSAALIALLLNSLVLQTYAAPQVGAAGAGGAAGGAAAAGGGATTSTTTTTSSSGTVAGGGAAGGAAGGLLGGTNLVGGMLNMASVPLNTLTASLTSLGVPNIATGALSAVTNMFQQAGTAYGR